MLRQTRLRRWEAIEAQVNRLPYGESTAEGDRNRVLRESTWVVVIARTEKRRLELTEVLIVTRPAHAG